MIIFVITLAATFPIVTFSQQIHTDDSTVASERLSRKMHSHQVVKGHFEQWRNLAGIPRPIRSNGRFIYWRNHGMYWETRTPILQASTFTPDAIFHWHPGTNTRQADRSSSPVQKQISRILLAVFGGNIRSLEKMFDYQWHFGPKPGSESNVGQWTVKLVPKAPIVKRIIEKITLSGEDFISSLKLDTRNGDTTLIHFTNINTFTHLAIDDCQYFDLDSSACPSNKSNIAPSSQLGP